ncbi:hypothetical protein BC628DRAFT_1314946 [Trametes gibbosa]|nr:hypothetical protein BC628DRAFT_1314946 [Trametes gibbosa]
MAPGYAASIVVMEMEDFEDQIFPTSTTTFAKEPLNRSAGFAKDLKDRFNGDTMRSGYRWERKDAILNAMLAGINEHNLAAGYWAKAFMLQGQDQNVENTATLALLYTKKDAAPHAQSDLGWTRARAFIQIESGGAQHDPFDEEDTSFDLGGSWEQTRDTARAHFLTGATSMFEYSHRFFFYVLSINDRHVRAVRVDHAGIVVTKPVDYVEDPTIIPRLLWHFSRLNDGQQGLDLTATMLEPSSADYKLMDKLGEDQGYDIDYEEGIALPPFTPRRTYELRSSPASSTSSKPAPTAAPRSRVSHGSADPRVFKYVRSAFKRSLCQNWPRYRLKVGEEGREFLVAQPAVGTKDSPFGRDCRAYIAVDCVTRQLVWLKDSWRPVNECSRPEGVLLHVFANDPKLFVPTLVCHGYVRQHSKPVAEASPAPRATRQTAAQAASKKRGSIHAGAKRAREDDTEGEQVQPGAKKRSRFEAHPLPLYRHYRIVVKEVCLDLEHFTNGWQLVRLIYDCIRTHHRAYKHYGLLHGDVSPWNILIYPTIAVDKKAEKEIIVWRGMLIDWELSTTADGTKPANPSGDGRTIMSWEFASIERVRHAGGQNTVEDELEAFFYVLVWHAVRYLAHDAPQPVVRSFVTDFFDTFFKYPDGALRAHDCKTDAIRDAQLRYADRVIRFCRDGPGPSHPLNGLVSELLRRLQARYAIIQQERQANGDGGGPARRPHPLDGAFGDDRAVLQETQVGAATAPGGLPAQGLRGTKARAVKTRELARSLESHAAVMKLFAEYAVRKDWPMDDRRPDHLAGTDYENERRYIDVPMDDWDGDVASPAEDA